MKYFESNCKGANCDQITVVTEWLGFSDLKNVTSDIGR